MDIPKFTLGMGDRFAHQGQAQLQAVLDARKDGIDLYPVWNKSFREHTIVGSQPADLRAEADAAVRALGWSGAYFVDADHIRLDTVDPFLEGSDFFTIDVADSVGAPAEEIDIETFLKRVGPYQGELSIPGLDGLFQVTPSLIRNTARKFLKAIQEAGTIYRHILNEKGSAADFIVEVSVDETDTPQTPIELLLILAMLSFEGIPAQTIAPKFTGRFNKGIDYVGDLRQFAREFDEDLSVLAFAIREFGLPDSLKLSVHSGSDKFSIYPVINALLKKHNAGLHVKTAGTTWLEEVIGLAESGGEGLAIAKAIYADASERFEELTAPYSTVIDVDPGKLPRVDHVNSWTGQQFAASLRHDPESPDYNRHLRQLLHVAFKLAAEMGTRFSDALKANAGSISENVSDNLLRRHIRPLFG